MNQDTITPTWPANMKFDQNYVFQIFLIMMFFAIVLLPSH